MVAAASARMRAGMPGLIRTEYSAPRTRFKTSAPPAENPFSVIRPAIGNTAPTAAISPTVTEGRRNVVDKKQAERNRNYLAGVAMFAEMLDKGLINEADCSALETEYAAKFLPLFRYEKPCFSSTLLITQTGEGSGLAATNAEDSRQAPQACTRRSAQSFDGRKEGRVIQ